MPVFLHDVEKLWVGCHYGDNGCIIAAFPDPKTFFVCVVYRNRIVTDSFERPVFEDIFAAVKGNLVGIGRVFETEKIAFFTDTWGVGWGVYNKDMFSLFPFLYLYIVFERKLRFFVNAGGNRYPVTFDYAGFPLPPG